MDPKSTENKTAKNQFMVLQNPLGGPFDLVSRVSKVGYGDYNRVSRGY